MKTQQDLINELQATENEEGEEIIISSLIK